MFHLFRSSLFAAGLVLLAHGATGTIWWNVGDPIQPGAMYAPVDNGYYLAGSVNEFWVTRGSDTDDWWQDVWPYSSGSSPDDMSDVWPAWFCYHPSGTGGSWTNGDNTGAFVYWIAPDDEAKTNILIEAWEDDLPKPLGWNEGGDRNDNPYTQTPPAIIDTRSIHTLIPWCCTMTSYDTVPVSDIPTPQYLHYLQPGGQWNERNEAAVWPRNHHATLGAQFQAAHNIQESDAVQVLGIVANDGGDIIGWGAYMTTFGTAWPVGTWHSASSNIANNVHETANYSVTWFYQCYVAGSDWVQMPTINNLRLFSLLSRPAGTLAYRRGVAASCRWGRYATTPYMLAAGMCTNVRATITYDPGNGSDRTDPIGEMLQMAANYGNITELNGPYNCREHAKLMNALCEYHTVAASLLYLWGGTANTRNAYWPLSVGQPTILNWASLAITAPTENGVPPNPHFFWHAISQVGATYWDPTYGQPNFPNVYCRRPDSLVPAATGPAVPVPISWYYPIQPYIYRCNH